MTSGSLWPPRQHEGAPRKAPLPVRLAVLGLLATAASLGSPLAWAAEPRVVYLNVSQGDFGIFGGADDDATENVSAVATVIPFPAFAWPRSPGAPTVSRQEAQAYLLFHLHKAFLPYNVLWTDVRPTVGPYTMVVLGGSPELLGFDRRVAGVAILDCGDKQPNNVVFAFPTPVLGDLHGLFITAAQETAHAFGLEHTEDEADIMHGKLGPAQWSFTNRLNQITPPRLCGPLTQNSHEALLAVLGAWPAATPKPLLNGSIPDVQAPAVVFVSPSQGAALTPPVSVTFRVDDPSGLAEVALQSEVGSHAWIQPESQGLFARSLDLPPGPASLHVWARDKFGNQAVHEVAFEVLPSPEPGGCTYGPRRHPLNNDQNETGATLFVLFLTVGACRRARR